MRRRRKKSLGIPVKATPMHGSFSVSYPSGEEPTIGVKAMGYFYVDIGGVAPSMLLVSARLTALTVEPEDIVTGTWSLG